VLVRGPEPSFRLPEGLLRRNFGFGTNFGFAALGGCVVPTTGVCCRYLVSKVFLQPVLKSDLSLPYTQACLGFIKAGFVARSL
jgi:hypothetical protein